MLNYILKLIIALVIVASLGGFLALGLISQPSNIHTSDANPWKPVTSGMYAHLFEE